MYDTSTLTPFKGERKPPFLHVEIDTKTLESLFDLPPSFENSIDFSELVSPPGGSLPVAASAASPPGIPDSAAVTSSAAASNDLLTLSSAATSQHLAEIERQPLAGVARTFVGQQQMSPLAVVPSTPSPVSHLPQPLVQPSVYHQAALSPSLTADDVSQALSDDSCAFMPEYEQMVVSTAAPSSSTAGAWAPEPFYSTVKTEELGLSSMTACSLEASLPGHSSSSSTSVPMKMEFGPDLGLYGSGHQVLSPTQRSVRSLSESSTATSSTMPDSPRRMSKGGSKRRQVPKGSEEYKEKRARNNVAVRKSRAKAKEKQRLTEHRVKDLLDQNDALTKKVDMLTKELTVLRGLFVNVGAQIPDDFSKLMEQS